MKYKGKCVTRDRQHPKFYNVLLRTWFLLLPLTIAILRSENLLRESPFKSSWIDKQKNREKDLDEELISDFRWGTHLSPLFQNFSFKSTLMNTKSFLSKSSLNATKIQDNKPTKMQVKSLKKGTTHNFKRYWRKFAVILF